MPRILIIMGWARLLRMKTTLPVFTQTKLRLRVATTASPPHLPTFLRTINLGFGVTDIGDGTSDGGSVTKKMGSLYCGVQATHD